MKASPHYLPVLALLAFLFCTAFMCQKDDATPADDPSYTSLIGYWKVVKGETYAINQAGETIVTATLNPGVFAHEFFDNGVYKGHDLTGTVPEQSGNWMLEVRDTDSESRDIEDGTLAIKTPATQSMAGSLFIDADGYQRFTITSINSPLGNGKPRIYLTSKRYEVYPYAENWAFYTFERQ